MLWTLANFSANVIQTKRAREWKKSDKYTLTQAHNIQTRSKYTNRRHSDSRNTRVRTSSHFICIFVNTPKSLYLFYFIFFFRSIRLLNVNHCKICVIVIDVVQLLWKLVFRLGVKKTQRKKKVSEFLNKIVWIGVEERRRKKIIKTHTQHQIGQCRTTIIIPQGNWTI